MGSSNIEPLLSPDMMLPKTCLALALKVIIILIYIYYIDHIILIIVYKTQTLISRQLNYAKHPLVCWPAAGLPESLQVTNPSCDLHPRPSTRGHDGLSCHVTFAHGQRCSPRHRSSTSS